MLRTTAILAAAVLATSETKAAVKAQSLEKYTNSHPLVIATDWEFPPFEYRDDSGDPKGYNIDVLSVILDNLDIPYTFVMREWAQAIALFQNRQADLIVVKNKMFDDEVYYGNTIFATYREGVAFAEGDSLPTDLSTLKPTDKVGFKYKDYNATLALKNGLNPDNIVYCSPQQGIHSIGNGSLRYYFYGETPMNWLINELHVTDVKVKPTQLQTGSFRVVGYDKNIVNAIDDQFARLDQSGHIKKLKNKWFHPEIYRKDASPWAVYLLVVIIVTAALIFTFNGIISRRINIRNKDIEEKNQLMIKALELSQNDVIELDMKTNMLNNIYGNMLPEKGMGYEEYIARIHPGDRKKAKDMAEELFSGQQTHKDNIYRWNRGTEEKPDWRFLSMQSLAEYDSKGKLFRTINTVKDITDQRLSEEEEKKQTKRFNNIFEKSILGLALYDAEGTLITVNNTMRNIFHFENPEDEFYFNYNLYDLPFLRDNVDRKSPHDFHFCTQIQIPERKMYDYLEIRMRPIENEEGELLYILLTARNISEDREIYRQSKENDIKLKAINGKVKQYESNLRYLLEVNKMRVWRSSLQNQEVAYFKDLHTYDVKMSFKDFISRIQQDIDIEKFYRMADNGEKKHKFHKSLLPIKNLLVKDDKTHWYVINSLPESDSKGNLLGYFGVIRDVTSLMEKQKKLKEETSRAYESGLQKSAFLANMTHEIRTPLNAIVGFCDLLQAIDIPEERKEFTRIIRNNCDMLLQLINDILMISSIDSNAKIIKPKDVDFSSVFDDICATLEQRIDKPGIQFIKDNPCASLPAHLDPGRIQQVITNFVTNAIKYTQKGHIKVGYRIEGEGIYIYCEDTGMGIPKDKCNKVFDRFVKLNDFIQGTGLGLSICKTITDQCGGRIGVDSELGKGSTFWIWIPTGTGQLTTN